ncbi:Uu.00g008180.m01.CDS01 [Anthostomella pinea]|uniref:E2 ubiquitin-conjugating enzyme n=1 Tax=Anthostomella pinea TaxID=933095 RepID=A0AAI8VX47_9PEZI|nr:Uu.00g008180.m01.CDS01 [Anthostomella pinea]
MSSAQKRISKEFQECTTSPPPGMTITLPSETDLHKWSIQLTGPPNTPYANGVFNLTLSLPTEYPFKAPAVNFATRIWHPNVTNDATGNICLSVLKPENWKPASRVKGVLEAVRQLLVEPNPDDPLEARIADEFRTDRAEFDKNARSYVAQYAKAGK